MTLGFERWIKEKFLHFIEIILSQCFIGGYNFSITRYLSIQILRLHWPGVGGPDPTRFLYPASSSLPASSHSTLFGQSQTSIAGLNLSLAGHDISCVLPTMSHYVTKAVIRISVHPSCMALTKIWKRNKAEWIREFFRQKLDQGVK